MGGIKNLQFDEQNPASLEELAERLGGEVDGAFIRCPSPGRSREDRSCCVRISPARPSLFYIYYCEGSLSAAYAFVRSALGIVAAPHNPKSSETARRIWFESTSAVGTLAERYLRGRGIAMPIPHAALRFHPALTHASGDKLPAMVAGVSTPSGDICAIHRTFLAQDGSGKANVDPARMTLGAIGGNAVRLCPVAQRLCVAEGIETALAVMQASGIGAWAALSAPGLKTINLPPEILHVIIAADGDAVGEAAAYQAAVRLRSEGRIAEIAQAPRGKDFNDLLRERQ